MQLTQHAREVLSGDVKQRRVGENAVKMAIGQIEIEKVLLPRRATALVTRHLHKALGAIKPDGDVAKPGKGLEVAPRTATEIENRERRLADQMAQQRCDILADVVIARCAAVIVGVRVVMGQRQGRCTRLLRPAGSDIAALG